ncbi:hypothetical protein L218DRAFT_569637 [Marasmius fiardii PR-910]|nr:hypothetical protein L218DRAFT_569637 [Marasmius fiardii PR-910]
MSEPSIRLPPEIWLRISSLLPKNDVLHLSETTTYFHYMIRPLLYHKVTLKKAPQILSTLSLLGRDKELARMVSELTLDTGNFLGSQQECLMDLNAMKHMTGLKRLALWGNICSLRDGGESMEKVFEVLHELRDLRELSIDASWNSFPEDHLSKIQHLEVVRWACIGPRCECIS